MADGFIPFSTQLDFIWNELQGKEKAGFGKFLSSGASTPEDFATLWDETYERSGGAGNEKARTFAGSVYNSLQGPEANPNLISPNAKTAFEFFRGKGLSPEMSSGITGRLMAESYEGLNPDARNRLGGGMGTYGIAQWRGSRIQDLANFAGVDINDITKLPNSFEGGGLLSPDAQSAAAMSFGNNEASKMINPLTPPMTPAVAQQAPAKRRGLGGLLDYAREVNPETGLSNLQAFGAALDPLIMNPNQRAGDSIRAGGARRVAAGRVNKTVEWLSQNGYGEMAEAVRLNPSMASNVFSAIAAQKMKTTNKFRPATPEEAAARGVISGQFEVINGVDGKFFTIQKEDISKELTGTNRTKAQNQVMAMGSIRNTIKSFRSLVKSGGIGVLPGAQRDSLLQTRTALQLQMKELFNLGVLSGPDLELMENMVFDTTNPKNYVLQVLTGETVKGRFASNMDNLEEQLEILAAPALLALQDGGGVGNSSTDDFPVEEVPEL